MHLAALVINGEPLKMKVFDNQVDLTAFWEKFEPKAYKCPAGVWTLGYGATMINGKPITPDMTCTEEEARKWLDTRIGSLYNNLIDKMNQPDKIEYHQYMSLCDYAYNCGLNAFPSLLSYLKTGNIESASHEFLDGFYVNKRPLLGLLLRRISEYNTFCNGTYIKYEKTDPISSQLKSLLLLKNGHNDAAIEIINLLRAN